MWSEGVSCQEPGGLQSMEAQRNWKTLSDNNHLSPLVTVSLFSTSLWVCWCFVSNCSRDGVEPGSLTGSRPRGQACLLPSSLSPSAEACRPSPPAPEVGMGTKVGMWHGCPWMIAPCVATSTPDKIMTSMDSGLRLKRMLAASPTPWSATTQDSRFAAPWLYGYSMCVWGGCPCSTKLLASPQISHCISFKSPNSIIQNAQRVDGIQSLLGSSLSAASLTTHQNAGSQARPRPTQSNMRSQAHPRPTAGYPVIPRKLSSYLWISLIFRLKSESNIKYSTFPRAEIWFSPKPPGINLETSEWNIFITHQERIVILTRS